MFKVSNPNSRSYVNFRAGSSYNGLERSLEAFKNKVIVEERLVNNGYVENDVMKAIDEKFQGLRIKALTANPKFFPELQKHLESAVKWTCDITSTYEALGDFEKKLADANV